jgi:dynactin 1
MSHLAGIHIPDDLQQHAEDVYMRSRLMQSRLENAAVAIYQIKSITQARIILPSDADEDDEATVERFVERADSLVSELRSSKVVASKAVKQLQELLSRSLTLDPSTQSTIEDCEKAVAGFVDACQSSASNVLKAINEEGREDGLTYDDVSRALCTQDSSPFSQLILQSQTINSKMHGLHVLTGTLAQSVEFSSPSSQAPWQMLSHKLKAEANASALHEKEVLRLKDELNEKITTVAMKEKVIGDLNVNVEVLSKRVNDSGGRKEKLKELEIAIEASRSREQESTAKLSSLSMELRELEKEREHWKQASATGIPASSGEAATAAGSIAVSEHTQAELKGLNKEVERTSALVRRLHGAAQRTIEPKSESWLAEPLVRRKMSGNHGRVVQESHEVLNSLLDIVNSPESIIAKFEVPQRSSRLAWRPASDSLAWRVGKQQEQWESWRDWQKSAATSHKRILTRMRRGAEMGAGSADGNATAQIGIKLPRAKVGTPDVRIVEADEWLEAQRRLGAV